MFVELRELLIAKDRLVLGPAWTDLAVLFLHTILDTAHWSSSLSD